MYSLIMDEHVQAHSMNGQQERGWGYCERHLEVRRPSATLSLPMNASGFRQPQIEQHHAIHHLFSAHAHISFGLIVTWHVSAFPA